MKNNIYTIIFAVIAIISTSAANLYADNRVAERIFMTTDREAYLAGENLWFSLYNFGADKKLSNFSKVAYIELSSANGTMVRARAALAYGRGGGRIELPPSLPTGNYQLSAYTKSIINEEGMPIFKKFISIYNTLTTLRLEDNIVVEEDSVGVVHSPSRQQANNIRVATAGADLKIGMYGGRRTIPSNSSIPISLTNIGKSGMTMNVSIVRNDELPHPNSEGISDDYVMRAANHMPVRHFEDPDFEGEVMEVLVTSEPKTDLTDKHLWLSAPGRDFDFYISAIDSHGKAKFYTNSIFGKRELAFEIQNIDTLVTLDFTITDPYAHIEVQEIPKMYLSEDMEEILKKRSIEMQIWRRFFNDSLYRDYRPVKDPLLLIDHIKYRLDDYTRFPVMSEVISEYVTELRFRELYGQRYLQMVLIDNYGNTFLSKYNTLVLLDGIPVFDHNKIYAYDPLKVKELQIFRREFLLGPISYSGIASFRTYKGDFPGFKLPNNVKIYDYDGVLPLTSFLGSEVELGGVPDVRSILYWNPILNLSSGEESEIIIHTPSYSGEFTLRIEGVTQDGRAFICEEKFRTS